MPLGSRRKEEEDLTKRTPPFDLDSRFGRQTESPSLIRRLGGARNW